MSMWEPAAGSGLGARLLFDDRRRRSCRARPRTHLLCPRLQASRRLHARQGREKAGGTAEHGFLYCGPSGAGHFVKMVHNGIEYGMMASYAEGLNISCTTPNAGKEKSSVDAETTPLRDPEHYQYDLNLADIAEVWPGAVSSRRGSWIWRPRRAR